MIGVTVAVAATLSSSAALAQGPSPYLPLNLSPEIERQIDQVLLLAGRPIVRRPIAAATVLNALPDACQVDALLCERVRTYLRSYTDRYSVTHASVEGAGARNSNKTLPNSFGMSAGDEWAASVGGQFRLYDHVQLQLGAVAYPGETIPSGSWLSIGTELAQLDIGYRDHWWSPMSDSAMLIGTQARTMPGITLSNYQPMTRFSMTYEAFIARMDYVDDIAYQAGTTAGHPQLAGLNVAFEPVLGWSLGASRVLQYGGGERKRSFGDLFNAFFRPTQYDNVNDSLNNDQQFGNQVAALTSKFVFLAQVPFSVYFEYAGEDGSRGEGWRLGNVSLSAGIDIPRFWKRFDLTYEVSDWQNLWYVNGVYPGGTSNDGHVIGHWGGDDRMARDAVGATSHMLRVGWVAPFGGVFDVRYRTLQNENYGSGDYRREHDLALRYSRTWNEFIYGAEIDAGRDVFGEDFRRVGAFVRYSPGARHEFVGVTEPLPRQAMRSVQIFVDTGVDASEVEYSPSDGGITANKKTSSVGAHIGVGVRRAVTSSSDLGVRIEMDDLEGMTALSVRAIDYRYRIGHRWAVGAYAGATRLDAPTAAYGYYGGINAQLRDVLPRLDVTVDVHASDKIARDVLLPSDPANNTWGDVFYQVYGARAYLSYRF